MRISHKKMCFDNQGRETLVERTTKECTLREETEPGKRGVSRSNLWANLNEHGVFLKH
jgi:hypothetical protein